MICGTFTIRQVDPADLADKMAEFQATTPAPLSVVSSPDGNGTFTIVATFPPCGPDVSHNPGPAPAAAPHLHLHLHLRPRLHLRRRLHLHLRVPSRALTLTLIAAIY